MGGLTSAASFIALLDEEQPELKYFALEKLNSLVDEFWPEVASDIQKVYVPLNPIPHFIVLYQ